MSSNEPQGSIEFDPVPLGPRRKRIDPVFIGVALVVVGLLVAIVKPWDLGSDATVAAKTSASPAVRGASASPSLGSSVTTPPDVPVDAPAVASILSAIQQHDAWGVRAIVAAPSGSDGPSERWVAALGGPEAKRTATGTRNAVIGSRDEPILALGVTTPRTATPLDLRIWRPTSDGDWERLIVRPVLPNPRSGELLLWPPGEDGSTGMTWPAGRYRIDLLMGTTIQRVDVAIPGRFERVPGAAAAAPPPDGLIFPGNVVPNGVAPGAFVVVDGQPWSVWPQVPTDVLGPARAWLDPGSIGGPGPQPPTFSVWLPRANGLGLVMRAGQTITDIDIRRIDPSPDPHEAPDVIIGSTTKVDHSRAYGLFTPRVGTVFRAGTYALHAAWRDKTGKHDGTWHIELTATRTRSSSALLDAARGFAPSAGSATIKVGTDVRLPDDIEGTSCDVAHPDDEARVLGISHPTDLAITDVQAAIQVGDGRFGVAVRLVPDVVPGMTLVAPLNLETFPPGEYRLVVRTGMGDRTLSVCLGPGPFPG